VGELAVILELDAEPAGVDLTRDGLGDAGLDAAVEGMRASCGRPTTGGASATEHAQEPET
jgi:hypothetical protein